MRNYRAAIQDIFCCNADVVALIEGAAAVEDLRRGLLGGA